MDIIYHKWLNLKIVHQYDLEKFDSIKLTPTLKTNKVLSTNNILFHSTRNGFELYIGLELNQRDLNSKLKNLKNLSFEILLKDSHFYNYTEIRKPISGETLIFHNTKGRTELIQEVSLFEDFNNINRIGIIQISIEDLNTENLKLTFNSLKVYKQYKIIVSGFFEKEVVDMTIESANAETYEGPIRETLVGGSTAEVFTSKVPLALFKKQINPPKLKIRYKIDSSSIREMELKLPNHSPDKLDILENGQKVATNYVHV